MSGENTPVRRRPGPTARSLDGVQGALRSLTDEVGQLRGVIADLRGEVRILHEQEARQDRELWSPEGFSRAQELSGQVRSILLQIKGLWAVLVGVTGFITTWALSHLR